MEQAINEHIPRKLLSRILFVKTAAIRMTIADVSEKLISFEKKGALFNRINKDDIEIIEKWQNLPVIGWIPEDESIRKFDREGINFFDMPDTEITEKFAEHINNFLHN